MRWAAPARLGSRRSNRTVCASPPTGFCGVEHREHRTESAALRLRSAAAQTRPISLEGGAGWAPEPFASNAWQVVRILDSLRLSPIWSIRLGRRESVQGTGCIPWREAAVSQRRHATFAICAALCWSVQRLQATCNFQTPASRSSQGFFFFACGCEAARAEHGQQDGDADAQESGSVQLASARRARAAEVRGARHSDAAARRRGATVHFHGCDCNQGRRTTCRRCH